MNPDPTSLDRLHDVIAPPPVPWWPPAPGWYWLISFAFILILVLILKTIIHWQRNRYRREALTELARHELALRDPQQRASALAAVAELLKRAALSTFPRTQVATLTGNDWFQFLDRTGRTSAFTQGHGAMLENVAYDPRTAGSVNEIQAAELASHIRHWLTHHRIENTEIRHPSGGTGVSPVKSGVSPDFVCDVDKSSADANQKPSTLANGSGRDARNNGPEARATPHTSNPHAIPSGGTGVPPVKSGVSPDFVCDVDKSAAGANQKPSTLTNGSGRDARNNGPEARATPDTSNPRNAQGDPPC